MRDQTTFLLTIQLQVSSHAYELGGNELYNKGKKKEPRALMLRDSFSIRLPLTYGKSLKQKQITQLLGKAIKKESPHAC
jgi:hypothetical protein